uniref:Uncharacterized protein n=1 Tax=Haptolina brevifila TaxID=156173 RepID=A0A7S2D776_9EUKA
MANARAMMAKDQVQDGVSCYTTLSDTFPVISSERKTSGEGTLIDPSCSTLVEHALKGHCHPAVVGAATRVRNATSCNDTGLTGKRVAGVTRLHLGLVSTSSSSSLNDESPSLTPRMMPAPEVVKDADCVSNNTAAGQCAYGRAIATVTARTQESSGRARSKAPRQSTRGAMAEQAVKTSAAKASAASSSSRSAADLLRCTSARVAAARQALNSTPLQVQQAWLQRQSLQVVAEECGTPLQPPTQQPPRQRRNSSCSSFI